MKSSSDTNKGLPAKCSPLSIFPAILFLLSVISQTVIFVFLPFLLSTV